MEYNSKSSAARRNGAPRVTRSDPSSKTHSNGATASQRALLRQSLSDLPDSRPDAVLRAKMLIADPGYPPEGAEEILARHLAVQLTDEIEPMPS